VLVRIAPWRPPGWTLAANSRTEVSRSLPTLMAEPCQESRGSSKSFRGVTLPLTLKAYQGVSHGAGSIHGIGSFQSADSIVWGLTGSPMHATPDCGRRHGRRGLAAEPGPREV
jgi:hypothetical protein